MSSTLPTISLTQSESTLFHHLRKCSEWINQNPQEVDKLRLRQDDGNWAGKARGEEPVELRIAGGWVRDKLLGQESDDIDVSTSPDPITGLKFALLFQKYLSITDQSHLMGKLTAIEAKPEQSKHLETATARVCGLSVDWVQQRGEVYDTDAPGRIPKEVTFGTPLEDAERRDLTINALFYNLQTSLIEDPTSKGLPDLGFLGGSKRIRTPVDDPAKTFLDDPLRVLRAVRFAARFGREYEIDERLKEAVGRNEIQAALGDPTRISRERVGIELEKMFLGHDPLYATELITSLNLYHLIFLNPPTPTAPATPVYLTHDPSLSPVPSPAEALALQSAIILHSLLHNPPPNLHKILSLSVVHPQTADLSPSSPTYYYPTALSEIYPTTVKRLYLSCSLLPLYEYSTYDKKPTNVMWVGEKVVRDGIKWSNGDKVWSGNARKACEVVSGGVAKYGKKGGVSKEAEGGEREEIGLILRNLAVHDRAATRWNVSLLWSLVVDLTLASNDPAHRASLVDSYGAFMRRVLSYGLEECAFAPSLLSGTEINHLLPSTKSSPAMVQIIDLVVRYQLRNPHATKEDCERWLLEDGVRQKVDSMVQSAVVLKKKKNK